MGSTSTGAVVLPCELPTLTVAGPPEVNPRQFFSVITEGNAQIGANEVQGALHIGGVMESYPDVLRQTMNNAQKGPASYFNGTLIAHPASFIGTLSALSPLFLSLPPCAGGWRLASSMLRRANLREREKGREGRRAPWP